MIKVLNAGNTKNEQAEAMRREAERRVAQKPEVLETMSLEEIQHVLHDLQVHQIELEMQNENLRVAHAQLDDIRALYFDLYNLAPVGYITLNEAELILESNLTAVTLLGTTRSVLMKMPISQFIFNEDQDIYYLYRKKLFETETTQMCELRMLKGDGEVFWAQLTATTVRDAAGTLITRVTLNDITARKQAEAEKDRLLTAINQMAETIIITDVEGMIQYANPAFEKITGYSCEEVLGQTPRVLKSGEQDAAFYKKLWGVLLNGEIWSGRLTNKKKDGTLYTEEATISPVKDINGKMVNYVAVKRDITEEINLEEQLRQSQKMESLGQLVGGVAHDFNNLLQVINGQAEMARIKLSANSSPADSINEICKASEDAKNLVQQLLIFSRQQVIDPTNLDLNKEIESTQRMLSLIIGEHIQFTFLAEKGLGQIFADKGQIHQVLMNLCMNARDAMPDGGRLTLKTQGVSIESDDLKSQTWARPGRYILLSVTDTGCGMDKAIRGKIFDPFFTTKEVGKGTGLGLSTVYGIVKQNKGHIAVYSEPGEGTTFNIYLPMSDPFSASTTDILVDAPQPAGDGTETILVAEDDAMILDLATEILNNAGYTILTAIDGLEAVRVFEKHADEIDLVMMDGMMPRMNGKEAMKKILKKCPAQRYLFVTGYDPDIEQKEGKSHLLSKPYRFEELLRKTREVLDA